MRILEAEAVLAILAGDEFDASFTFRLELLDFMTRRGVDVEVYVGSVAPGEDIEKGEDFVAFVRDLMEAESFLRLDFEVESGRRGAKKGGQSEGGDDGGRPHGGLRGGSEGRRDGKG